MSQLLLNSSFLSVPINEAIPDIEDLKSTLKEVIDYLKSEEEKDYFKKALKVLSEDNLNVMIIGDYNTSGITGVNTEDNSKWHNLIL